MRDGLMPREQPQEAIVGKKHQSIRRLDTRILKITTQTHRQSWLGKTEQVDKWSFCLNAAKMTANRRDYEQTTAPEPHTGI